MQTTYRAELPRHAQGARDRHRHTLPSVPRPNPTPRPQKARQSGQAGGASLPVSPGPSSSRGSKPLPRTARRPGCRQGRPTWVGTAPEAASWLFCMALKWISSQWTKGARAGRNPALLLKRKKTDPGHGSPAADCRPLAPSSDVVHYGLSWGAGTAGQYHLPLTALWVPTGPHGRM